MSLTIEKDFVLKGEERVRGTGSETQQEVRQGKKTKKKQSL